LTLNSQIPTAVNLTFFPNGTIDTARTSTNDLEEASIVFIPSTPTPANISTFWTKVNWIYVSLFWTILYDLGQIAPTFSNQSVSTLLPSTNNIFIDASLFDTYSQVLQNVILPDLNYTLPDFSRVSDTNRLQPGIKSIFLQSYSYLQRTRKELLRFIVLVLAADISFILAGSHTVMAFAEKYSKYKNPAG
jgi:hypothetical protein